MNENAVTGVSVVTVMVSPGSTVAGHAVMPGRGAGVLSAFSRYGGEKIWPSGWFCLRGAKAMRGISVMLHVGKIARRSGGQGVSRECPWVSIS